jgi:cellulose synthase/poly-beta-1,6-N-acetylglucosamine synthase-like glycosyltransferase
VFSGYPLLMLRFALRHKNAGKDYSYQPFISVLVPMCNEEAVIEKRIQNLRDLQYPKEKYEILVVDSGSMNVTKSIVGGSAKKMRVRRSRLYARINEWVKRLQSIVGQPMPRVT